ncbi:MAG: hypothetical protein DRN30_06805 [Thermoplasmata archaeon]|nr:MAG: hypothetical protein DRN30_06805 [Thermoplasmata archaeon]
MYMRTVKVFEQRTNTGVQYRMTIPKDLVQKYNLNGSIMLIECEDHIRIYPAEIVKKRILIK